MNVNTIKSAWYLSANWGIKQTVHGTRRKEPVFNPGFTDSFVVVLAGGGEGPHSRAIFKIHKEKTKKTTCRYNNESLETF